MKKRILMFCLSALCALVAAGCGTEPAVSENAAISSQAAVDSEDTFSSEDMSCFVFEGTEYTFPMSYDVLMEQGWEITDYSYELLSEEDLETNFLELANEQYPGVVMEISIFNSRDPNNAYGSVDELIQEFEDNGIWGICIHPEEDETDVTSYPDLSFKGVTFGSSVDNIISAFGTDFGPTYVENQFYIYSTIEDKQYRCLYFEVDNDAIYCIYASYG